MKQVIALCGESDLYENIQNLKRGAARKKRAAVTATINNIHHPRADKFRSMTVYFLAQGQNPSLAELENKARWSYTHKYVEQALRKTPTHGAVSVQLNKFLQDSSLKVSDVMEL